MSRNHEGLDVVEVAVGMDGEEWVVNLRGVEGDGWVVVNVG